jgi:hypothetical protein
MVMVESSSADGAVPQFILGGAPTAFVVEEKNTFVDVEIPKPPEALCLRRLKSEPPPNLLGASRTWDELLEAEPALVPEEELEAAYGEASEGPGAMPIPALASAPGFPGGAPPPPLPLEFFVTPDPFETFELGAGPLGPGPLAFSFSPGLAERPPPPPLILEKQETFDEFECPQGLTGLAERPPPPPLMLEKQETFDEFECPQVIGSSMSAALAPGACMGVGVDAGVGESGLPVVPMQPAFLSTVSGMLAVTTAPALQAAPEVPASMPCLPPPCVPAPLLQEQPTPAAPKAAPAEEAAVPPPPDALPPNALVCTLAETGSTHVHWAVDGRKLDSQDRQVISPEFMIDMGDMGPQRFKMAIHPTAVLDKFHGRGFKKAKGRGKIELKCESQLPQGIPDVVFSFRIGRADRMQPPRGPVTHNFSERSCAGLQKNQEEWELKSAIDETGTFVVSLQAAAAVATPA